MKELQAKARTHGFPISLSTPYGEMYQRLAFPVKEKGKRLHRKVLSDMPTMHRHAQVCLTHLGGSMDFHHVCPKKIDHGPC